MLIKRRTWVIFSLIPTAVLVGGASALLLRRNCCIAAVATGRYQGTAAVGETLRPGWTERCCPVLLEVITASLWLPLHKECPNLNQCVLCFTESNEFILYAVRNSIHRYDLATGTDQPLPLVGLREAVALDFDYDRNCLYWADISLDTIQV